MIYKVTLNGKAYEVEVEKGEAIIQAEYDMAIPVAPTAAPVVAAPVVAAPVDAAQSTAQVAAPAAPVATQQPTANAGANTIKAPLPGNINAVKVQKGQNVKKGEVLIILEAMKMENEIVAPNNGTVGEIYVQKGAVVETGAPLVDLI